MATNKAGHFGFSAVRIEDLQATEYTLVTIVVDRSGSTEAFYRDMEKTLKQIVEACQKSPRADNLLLRVIVFGDDNQEIHGWVPLNNIKPDQYDNALSPGGMTALYDATINGVEGIANFAKQLRDEDYSSNGIIFILTDGEENHSKLVHTDPSNRAKFVKDALQTTLRGEHLESLVSILVAVNATGCQRALQQFHNEAGFTQYIDMGDASPQKLAKLAQFVSKSISSQSQALGSGGPSQSIAPTF